jgi:methionine biosynthesis protein MetW
MFYFVGTRKPNFKNAKFFDYEEYWRFRGIKIREKLRDREKIFIDWIKDGSSVLDIACGDSPLLGELKRKKNCQVEGFDLSSLIVEEQKKSGVPAQVQDIGAKDFKLEKKYDYIVLSETVEHLVLPEELIKKIKGQTKHLIISIPNSAFYRYRLDFLWKGRFFTQWAYHPAEHLRFWSHLDFLDWLRALDLEIVACQASNGLTLGPLKFFKWWKNLFGYQICYLVKT